MQEGLSTNRRCEASAACLVAAGKGFVFRYHSRQTTQAEKRLHPREAAELARAGLSIATVYQDNARQLVDFGAARGEQDGISALVYAGQTGQPPGSAVYFAVDSDFSAAEITSAVFPYFRAVAQVFAEAGKGAPYLRIGVYGSGLTCRLIGQLPFVAFTWLAESTGWRESKIYSGWSVRQHLNTGQALCALGNDFERCEANDAFGQFRPVGFDITSGQGELRRVKAEGGNIRHLPSTAFVDLNTPIALLPQGHEVHVLGASAPGWLRVRTTLGGGELIGHMALSRLEVVNMPAPPPPAPALPRAVLGENNPAAARASTSGYAYPPGEAGRPTRDGSAAAPVKCLQLRALADWLAVPTSARYRPRDGKTFCNIYAADYAYLASVYLPRVWWTDQALVLIGQGQTVQPLYAQTVREMRADDLFAWLVDIGPSFGWKRIFDATALQACANNGGVGVICADREAEGRAGHISVVVPEDDAHRAKRDADGHVTQPLQSQAGATNWRYGSAGPDWWRGAEFRDRGFFVHD